MIAKEVEGGIKDEVKELQEESLGKKGKEAEIVATEILEGKNGRKKKRKTKKDLIGKDQVWAWGGTRNYPRAFISYLFLVKDFQLLMCFV